MKQRISSRALIFDGHYLYTIFRRRLQKDGTYKEYYIIPGGGIEENETLEQAVIREVKEELSVDIEVEGYIGSEEFDRNIAHLYKCNIVSGIPKLGGKEKEKSCDDNYYEIKKINIFEMDDLDIYFKYKILKAYYNEFI